MAIKVCFKCNRSLPTSEFYRNRGMADGLLGKCKECTREDSRASRRKRLDYYRRYDAIRYYTDPVRRQRSREAARLYSKPETNQKWKAANKEKRLAHSRVAHAIESGKLVRLPCEVCGDVLAHAHHDDYSKPLEVRWLCPKHHGEHHRKYDLDDLNATVRRTA